jgi:hypothetical protein
MALDVPSAVGRSLVRRTTASSGLAARRSRGRGVHDGRSVAARMPRSPFADARPCHVRLGTLILAVALDLARQPAMASGAEATSTERALVAAPISVFPHLACHVLLMWRIAIERTLR